MVRTHRVVALDALSITSIKVDDWVRLW